MLKYAASVAEAWQNSSRITRLAATEGVLVG
jgi:hypothetical protein